MSQIMDLLRGPVIGVIFMIILLAGILLITAFAALVAQFGLLLRWKLQQIPPRDQEPVRQTVPDERSKPTRMQVSPQVVANEPDPGEIIDAEWWPEGN
jgi:hypothetical protein